MLQLHLLVPVCSLFFVDVEHLCDIFGDTRFLSEDDDAHVFNAFVDCT